MTNQLPPRERGFKPTHFIEVWKGRLGGKIYYGANSSLAKLTASSPEIELISNFCPDTTTIAIFKIYPKNIS